MQAVKPSDPAPSESSAPPPGPADPAQTLRLLEMELARRRASRLARESSGGPRPLQVFSIVFLLALLAAGCFALWRVQAMHDGRQPAPGRPSPAPASAPPR